jgi:hypothetical protein
LNIFEVINRLKKIFCFDTSDLLNKKKERYPVKMESEIMYPYIIFLKNDYIVNSYCSLIKFVSRHAKYRNLRAFINNSKINFNWNNSFNCELK